MNKLSSLGFTRGYAQKDKSIKMRMKLLKEEIRHENRLLMETVSINQKLKSVGVEHKIIKNTDRKKFFHIFLFLKFSLNFHKKNYFCKFFMFF